MTDVPTLPVRQQLSTKITGVLFGFLVLALVAIGATLMLSWQLEGSAAAINEAGSLRMHGYKLAASLAQDAHKEVRSELTLIDRKFDNLRHGDPQRPLLLPHTDEIETRFEQAAKQWMSTLKPLAAEAIGDDGAKRDAARARFQAEVHGFVSGVDRLVSLVERDSELRTFWLRSSQFALAALAVAGTIGVVYLMFLLIIAPVERLREGIERMTRKDFGVRLAVNSSDEFGTLAAGFNEMADRLENLYNSLEERVRRKTAALADQNRELGLLYDTAAFLQQPQTLEAMCQGFLERIGAYFGADGGSVRTLDDRRGNLHMVVHHGLSPLLAQSERCLKVGDCLCGEAVEKKIAVVHDLRRMDEAYELQCHREGFATVSVFHIYSQQQHIGFFNLHFRKPRIFGKNEEALLETLGQLLGAAIENLRLGTREREMAISEERNLLAQGLHDSIAQGLTFLNIQVQLLEDSLRAGLLDEAAGIVPLLRAGVQESYDDVRELLLNFRNRLAEDDLPGALAATVQKFRQQTGIDARFSMDGNGPPFPREQQLQVLFIVQEALSNIRKHAKAQTVDIRIDDGNDFLLTIHDNGVGFDAAAVREKGDSHVGMNIMRERARRIHADLVVTSAPGNGTTVKLELPHEQRYAA